MQRWSRDHAAKKPPVHRRLLFAWRVAALQAGT